MSDISVSELRKHLPKYLKAVQRGETVTITSHGTPIAELHGTVDRKREAADKLAHCRRKARIDDVITPVGEDWDAERDRS